MVDNTGGVVAGGWQARVTGSVVQENDTSALVRAVTRFQAVNTWRYQGLNGRYSATVNGQTANSSTTGGISVGSNGSQDLVTKDVWVTKGHGVQNVGFAGSITITGYAAGTSSANGTVQIRARPSYTVSYNANGGTGAPASQTKWYGENLNLSSTRPTRSNYTFQGWATSAGGTVAYQPGGTVAENRALALYAVWKIASMPPVIDTVTVNRCSQDGTITADGDHAGIWIEWHVDTAADTSNTGRSIAITVAAPGQTGTSATEEISGASGSMWRVFDGAKLDQAYTVTVALTDLHQTTRTSATIPPASFLLDINWEGTGIGIGQAAPDQGIAINGTPITLNGTLRGTALAKSALFVWWSTWSGIPADTPYTESTQTIVHEGGLLLCEVAAAIASTGEYGMAFDFTDVATGKLAAHWGATSPQKNGGTLRWVQTGTVMLPAGTYKVVLTSAFWGTVSINGADSSGNSRKWRDAAWGTDGVPRYARITRL